MRRPGSSAAELLGSRLPEPAEEQRFADAVVHQLTGSVLSPRSEAIAETVDEVVAILRWARTGRGEPPLELLSDPPLLAAVFQNMDLLYEAGFTGADRLGRLVLEVVGSDSAEWMG